MRQRGGMEARGAERRRGPGGAAAGGRKARTPRRWPGAGGGVRAASLTGAGTEEEEEEEEEDEGEGDEGEALRRRREESDDGTGGADPAAYWPWVRTAWLPPRKMVPSATSRGAGRGTTASAPTTAPTTTGSGVARTAPSTSWRSLYPGQVIAALDRAVARFRWAVVLCADHFGCSARFLESPRALTRLTRRGDAMVSSSKVAEHAVVLPSGQPVLVRLTDGCVRSRTGGGGRVGRRRGEGRGA